METFLQDLRYSFRTLAKAPGYTAVAVLTLALGVGANAAIFSVLQAVVLRDLPYHEPDRMAVMWTRNIQQNLPDGSSYLNFRDWKAQSRQFEQMAAYLRPEFTRSTLERRGESVRIKVGLVGPGLLRAAGHGAAGRSRPSWPTTSAPTPRAVVISHGLWQQRFARRSARVVGTDDATGRRQRRNRRRDAAASSSCRRRTCSSGSRCGSARRLEGRGQPRAATALDRARPPGALRDDRARRAPRWTPSPRVCATSYPDDERRASASPPTRWSIASSDRRRSDRCGCSSARSGSCC